MRTERRDVDLPGMKVGVADPPVPDTQKLDEILRIVRALDKKMSKKPKKKAKVKA